jgi:hypothetical protein
MKPAIKYLPKDVVVGGTSATISFDKPTDGAKRLAGIILYTADKSVWNDARIGLVTGSTTIFPGNMPMKNVVVDAPSAPNTQPYKFAQYIEANDRVDITITHAAAPASEYPMTCTLIYTDEEGEAWKIIPPAI